MDEAKKQALQALSQPLDEIAACNPDELAEREALGEINFEEGKPLFQQTIDLAKEARSLPLELLPVQIIQQLQGPAQNVAQGLQQISDFRLAGQQNPEQQRNQLLQKAQSQYDAFLTAFMPHLPYLTLKSAQVQDVIRQSAELLKDTQKNTTATLEEFEKKKAELDSIVRAARDAAAKIGVAQFATKFEEIADDHSNASKQWLWATILLGAGTVALASLFLFLAFKDTTDPVTIQQIVTKVVIISLVYIAAIWSSRNYRAHRHLVVVNRHRPNALATFETFVKAASEEDQQTKNAVLLEATRCIFSPSVTGYIGTDTDTSSSRVIEILKTVGSET